MYPRRPLNYSMRGGALATQKSSSLGVKYATKVKGKKGLVLAGLAAAGGLGLAGAKALQNRKPKSVQDRVKKAVGNAQNKAASTINANPFAKKMSVKVRKMR